MQGLASKLPCGNVNAYNFENTSRNKDVIGCKEQLLPVLSVSSCVIKLQ